MRTQLLLPLVVLTLSLAKGAYAACNCACVDGRTQNVCDTPADTPAFCAVQSCGPAPPAPEPLPADTPPPGLMRSCAARPVYDPTSQRIVTRTYCQTVAPPAEETPAVPPGRGP